MTTVGANTNPYGDQSGAAPDWDYLKGLSQTAFNNAKIKAQQKRSDIFNQFGLTGGSNIESILRGGADTFSLDPTNTAGAFYQNMLGSSKADTSLRMNLLQRGVQDSGIGGQAINELTDAKDMGINNLRSQALSQLAGANSGASDAYGKYQTDLTDIGRQQGAYEGWGKSHFVSEGGNIADPSDWSLNDKSLQNLFHTINLKDPATSGASLGRIRQMIEDSAGMAGEMGYNSTQLKSYITRYKQMLKAAGFQYKGKWALSFDNTSAAPAKSAPKKKKKSVNTPNPNYDASSAYHRTNRR